MLCGFLQTPLVKQDALLEIRHSHRVAMFRVHYKESAIRAQWSNNHLSIPRVVFFIQPVSC